MAGFESYRRYKQHCLRLDVAGDVAQLVGASYDDVLKFLEENRVFSTWSLWDINHKHVNLESIANYYVDYDYEGWL